MAKSVFITATGTDVGKTYVSGLLVKKMRDFGLNCGYFKPALSGAELINEKLVPGDCAHVLKTAGINKPPEEFVSYIFEPAVSPHLASEIEENYIHTDKIKKDFNRVKKEFDYIITEGCGGIICPLNLHDERIMLTDIIKMLGQDIIIVASAGLGTINYTALTIAYARQLGINIRGIIMNNYDETNVMHQDNLKRIEELTSVNVIATVKVDEKDLNIDKNTILSIFREI